MCILVVLGRVRQLSRKWPQGSNCCTLLRTDSSLAGSVSRHSTIDGEWELEGGSIDEGEGDFNLELDFTDYDPFGGSLTGEVEMDDDSNDGDDDEDDEDDD